MSEKGKPDEPSSSDSATRAIESFVTGVRGLSDTGRHSLRWFSEWAQERHFITQVILSVIIGSVISELGQAIVQPILTLYLDKPIVLQGSVYISTLPVPLSVAVYSLLVLVVFSMLSNHQNQKEIEALRAEIQSNGEN